MPMTLSWIIFTCIFGGVISFIFALMFLKYANSSLLNHMVSLAVGTLLGAAFLEIIPHAFELSNDVHQVTFVVLIGILILFIVKLETSDSNTSPSQMTQGQEAEASIRCLPEA